MREKRVKSLGARRGVQHVRTTRSQGSYLDVFEYVAQFEGKLPGRLEGNQILSFVGDEANGTNADSSSADKHLYELQISEKSVRVCLWQL